MGSIKYNYAYNESKEIIDIKEITSITKEVSSFYCISCGAEMIAKLGKKNRHHFAHKEGDASCSSETYLHVLAKQLLKQKFDKFEVFEIEYLRHLECKFHDSCLFYEAEKCYTKQYEKFDLKRHYDTCSLEHKQDNYKVDLLISNSLNKQIKPIIIEIRVTHACTEEKRKNLKNIIEIKINSDEDIRALMEAPIKECSHIEFINIKRESKKEKTALDKKRLFRFYLLESGSTYVSNFEDMPGCSERRTNKKAILELKSDVSYFENIGLYKYGLAYASKIGYDIKNCNLCKYYHPNGMSDIYCRMSKRFGTPAKPKQTKAQDCQYYKIDQNEFNRLVRELNNIRIQKVE